MSEYKKLEEFIYKYLNTDEIIFLHSNCNNILDEKTLKENIKEFNNFNYKYYKFNENIQSPYCPFMDFLRNIYIEKYSKKVNAYDFTCLCNVYEMQKKTIAKFFETGISERKEHFILGEIIYEQERFIESIINIIKFITKDIKLNIVLDSIHFAATSTINLINSIILKNSKHPIKNFTLIIYSMENAKIPAYNKENWHELLTNAEKNDLALTFMPSPNYDINTVYHKKLPISDETISNALFHINNLINMLAIDQASFYLDNIYKELSSNKNLNKISKKNLALVLEKMIVVNTYKKYSSNLIRTHKKDYYYINFLCEKLKECYSDENSYIYYKYNYLRCIINHINNKQDIAYEHYEKCLNYAKNHKSSWLEFKSDYAYYFYLCYDKNQTTRRKSKITKDEINLCKKLHDYKYFNTLIYMYLYNFECDDESIKLISSQKKNFVYLEKAVNIARKLNNTFFLDLAYGRKATFFTAPKINNYLFQKDINMQKELGKELSIPKYSFMAYKYTMNEDYDLSHKTNLELVNKLYKSIIKGDIKQNMSTDTNTMELLLAFYNMATNCICSEEYNFAIRYLNIVFEEMQLLNCFDLSMCDLSKIYVMNAYCYYKSGSNYKASIILNNFEHLLSFALNNEKDLLSGKSLIARNDSMFLYHITKSLINLNDEKLDSCANDIEKAYIYYKNENGQKVFMLPILAEAVYKVYTKLGKTETAKNSIKTCIKFCVNNNLINLKKRMESLLNSTEYIKPEYDFSLKGIDETDIKALLKTKRLETQLANYLNDFSYISLWSKTINTIQDTYDIAFKNSMELISNYLNTKNMAYITISDNKNDYDFFKQRCKLNSNKYISAYYVNDSLILSNNKLIEIVKYFYRNTNSITLKRTDKKFFTFEFVPDVIDKNNAVTFIAAPTLKNNVLQSIFLAFTSIENTGISNTSLIDHSKLNALSIMLDQLYDSEKLYSARLELIKTIEIANNANKAKSRFLANMSHEIRTPINTILGMNEMILREAKEQNILNYGNHINSAGTTLLALINEILDFSKIESGKMELVNVQYAFKNLITDIYNMISNRAEKKSLELIFNIDKNIPCTLLGDDIRIKQILVNILTNAIKYTNNGHVILDINIASINNDNININFSVTDTGIGIKEEAISELFESFTRVDLRKTRNIEGTGLGLAITEKLLKMMNSTLNVKSIYGKGSTFYFSLNQKIVDKTPINNININSANSGPKKTVSYIAPDAKILVVDDNDMNRLVIKQLLKSSKIQITTASSGFECLKYVTTNKYHIIFLDHMMPEMDGIETLKKLKTMNNNLNNDTPMIVLTANAISGAKEMYLKEGFDNYISKPIDPNTLDKMILKYLPKNFIKEVANEDISVNNTSAEKELISIPGINVYEAMKFNNSNESFLEMLNIFYNTIEDKANLIEKLEKEENIKDYTTYVHALKSSSKLIGATMLSQIALELEKAGNDCNIAKIHSETPFLLQIYRKYISLLKPFLNPREDAPKELIKNNILKKDLNNIFNAIDNFDLDTAENLMKNIKKYAISDNLKDDINSLDKFIQNYNAEEILNIIPNILNKIN